MNLPVWSNLDYLFYRFKNTFWVRKEWRNFMEGLVEVRVEIILNKKIMWRKVVITRLRYVVREGYA